MKNYSTMKTPQPQSRVNSALRKQQTSTERYNKKLAPSHYHEHCGDDAQASLVLRNVLDNANAFGNPHHVDAVFDSEEWSSNQLKSKLVQIDQYLDIDKLITDIRKQDKDSYSIRCLLAKVKEHSSALL